MFTAETDAPLNGRVGRAWMVPEPHPGHMLVHRMTPVVGVSWFLLSVDLETLRVVLRGVDPDHEPEEGVDLALLDEPLLAVEVPAGLHMDDFVQLPGELARAVIRDLIVPDPTFGAQWKAAVARILAVLRRRRGHTRTQADIGKRKADERLKRERAKRRKKKRGRKSKR